MKFIVFVIVNPALLTEINVESKLIKLLLDKK